MSSVVAPRTSSIRVALRGGEQILLHRVSAADQDALLGLLEHVTGDARLLRFFTAAPDIRRAAAEGARCDDAQRIGVLALSADEQEVLGHGMCVSDGGSTAEVAFEVADGHRRHGIGGVLLRELVAEARRAGYRELVAEVLPRNRDMLDMLEASGMAMTSRVVDGVRHVAIPLAPPAGSRGGGA